MQLYGYNRLPVEMVIFKRIQGIRKFFLKKKTKKILKDHKQIGKKFVPPMLQLQGGMKFVKWLDKILPELIWLRLLHEKLGIKRSVEICCSIARAIKEIYQEEHSTFALISNYKKLTDT